MEQERFNPSRCREVWRKESQQLQQKKLCSQQELLRLIHTPRQSQYQRRCRENNVKIMLLILLIIASFIALYFTLQYSHLFWNIASVVSILLLTAFLINRCYERYLLWCIHPYNRRRMDVDVVAISQSLIARKERRVQRFRYFVDNNQSMSQRIRWVNITKVSLGGVALVVLLCILFPLKNLQCSQQDTILANHVVCNQSSCESAKYCEVAYVMLNSDVDIF